MDQEIASCHWRACETCIHGNVSEGCKIEDDFKYDNILDGIICKNYESKEME